jgi:hypothetical protein
MSRLSLEPTWHPRDQGLFPGRQSAQGWSWPLTQHLTLRLRMGVAIPFLLHCVHRYNININSTEHVLICYIQPVAHLVYSTVKYKSNGWHSLWVHSVPSYQTHYLSTAPSLPLTPSWQNVMKYIQNNTEVGMNTCCLKQTVCLGNECSNLWNYSTIKKPMSTFVT